MKTRLLQGLLFVLILSLLVSTLPETVLAADIKSKATPPDPDFEVTGNMHSPRVRFTLSLLPNGTALATGGYYYDTEDHYLNTSEYYNPENGLWYLNDDNLSVPRSSHTATTLKDGRVLIVGGENARDILSSAELYNPATRTWTNATSMTTARVGHTATLLRDGRVLVVGGCYSAVSCSNTAEIYNPTTNTWSSAASMNTAGRRNHAAVLMKDGKVLVSGGMAYGVSPGTYFQSVEIYDPDRNAWTERTSMASKRSEHFMVVRRDGKVLVVGGFTRSLGPGGTVENFLRSSELFDPAGNSWTASVEMWMVGRRGGASVLDAYDRYYLLGGYNDFFLYGLFSTEYRDIDNNDDWVANDILMQADRFNHAAVQLANGAILIAGGQHGSPITTYDNTAEIYLDTRGNAFAYSNTLGNGTLGSSGTLLPDGNVLINGGAEEYAVGESRPCTTKAYIWRSDLDDRDDLADMNNARCNHSTVLLNDGRVAVFGGNPSYPGASAVNSFEILTETGWQRYNNGGYEFGSHTATLLPDGEVLIMAQELKPYGLLFNPVNMTLRRTTGTYTGTYFGHTATLLKNGKVLIAGSGSSTIIELYDPATETFSPAAALSYKFNNHSATLLNTGQVLFVGGRSEGLAISEVVLYNPGSNNWTSLPNLSYTVVYHSATLLPDGKVAIVGGQTYLDENSDTVIIFDPANYQWTVSGTLNSKRMFHDTLLTPEGGLIVFGGLNHTNDPVAAVERYSFYNAPPPLASGMWRPTVSSALATQQPGGLQYQLTGSELTGDVEASNGLTGQSASNVSLVQVIRLDNQQTIWLEMDTTTSPTAFLSKVTSQMQPGPALIFAYANGSRSRGKIVFTSEPPPQYAIYLPLILR